VEEPVHAERVPRKREFEIALDGPGRLKSISIAGRM